MAILVDIEPYKELYRLLREGRFGLDDYSKGSLAILKELFEQAKEGAQVAREGDK